MASTDPSSALVHALRQVMRPIVRLLLAKGVSYGYFSELLKDVFIDVAEHDFPIDGKRQSDSRLSLISGVHRKDVKRIRAAGNCATLALPEAVSYGARLVATWANVPPYCDEALRPRPLPRHARYGGELSFESLVGNVVRDVRPRVVLDEWLRLGVVSLDEQDNVVLNVNAFIPQKGFEEKVAYFGHNVHDHAAAAVHNLVGEGTPFFERAVHYDALSKESVAQISERVGELGMETLISFNRLAMELEQRDAATLVDRHRITVGLYCYTEPADGKQED
ncbi:hypothetical protein J5J83_13070 [Azoarcus sp. L1K30]|uniref:DUF6502 family protein n=1 Tax=Azoarcus sp. L1K30 TaxID=2820277 RepID=UPI001B82B16B|nr:DUF6502 family protein [Azoarcus sp. L1K30]MBR0567047.1 hypothetical protein [Azoarcus sp. L1K30]